MCLIVAFKQHIINASYTDFKQVVSVMYSKDDYHGKWYFIYYSNSML